MVTYVWSKYQVASLVAVLAVCFATASAVAIEPGRSDDRRSLQRGERAGKAPTIAEMVIPAGPHYLTTAAGQARVPIVLPADFFFEGSGPIAQLVELQGVPIADKPIRKDGFSWEFAKLTSFAESLRAEDDWGQRIDVDREWRRTAPYDTVMVQFQRAVLPDVGSEATVDLKLAEVRLDSLEPMEVTGTRTAEYDVSLEISPFHRGEGRFERMGSMTFTRDGLVTGHFTSEVYGWARFTFTPVDGGEALIFDHDELLTIGTNEPTPFVVDSMLPTADGGIAALNKAPLVDYCCGMGSYCVLGMCGQHCP